MVSIFPRSDEIRGLKLGRRESATVPQSLEVPLKDRLRAGIGGDVVDGPEKEMIVVGAAEKENTQDRPVLEIKSSPRRASGLSAGFASLSVGR